MGTLPLAVRSLTEPTSSNHGPITDTELEEPAPSDTDTELEESAPAFHAAGGEVAQTDRRRRRNSNGGPVGPLIRAWAKRTKRLSDHLAPAVSCKLARVLDFMEWEYAFVFGCCSLPRVFLARNADFNVSPVIARVFS
ncbi:unnamed protein product [Ectocarpus sp. 12 AP-2014]